jgi:hypothetical protein
MRAGLIQSSVVVLVVVVVGSFGVAVAAAAEIAVGGHVEVDVEGEVMADVVVAGEERDTGRDDDVVHDEGEREFAAGDPEKEFELVEAEGSGGECASELELELLVDGGSERGIELVDKWSESGAMGGARDDDDDAAGPADEDDDEGA